MADSPPIYYIQLSYDIPMTISITKDTTLPKGFALPYVVSPNDRTTRLIWGYCYPPRSQSELDQLNKDITIQGLELVEIKMGEDDYQSWNSGVSGSAFDSLAPKCECGATKCSSNIHSPWCPVA